jgi:hypothetical protein
MGEAEHADAGSYVDAHAVHILTAGVEHHTYSDTRRALKGAPISAPAPWCVTCPSSSSIDDIRPVPRAAID